VASLGIAQQSTAAGSRPPKTAKSAGDGQVLFVGDNIAVAKTEYGKVRGFILRDIHQFLGIPYGADTIGKNRFMPPQKPTVDRHSPRSLVGKFRSANHGKTVCQPVCIVC
jgi:para-nitrobenzyl esterase